jgi:hypothetical protein
MDTSLSPMRHQGSGVSATVDLEREAKNNNDNNNKKLRP